MDTMTGSVAGAALVRSCDKCGAPARYSVQTGWMFWEITQTGEYRATARDFLADDMENDHLCQECWRAER